MLTTNRGNQKTHCVLNTSSTDCFVSVLAVTMWFIYKRVFLFSPEINLHLKNSSKSKRKTCKCCYSYHCSVIIFSNLVSLTDSGHEIWIWNRNIFNLGKTAVSYLSNSNSTQFCHFGFSNSILSSLIYLFKLFSGLLPAQNWMFSMLCRPSSERSPLPP